MQISNERCLSDSNKCVGRVECLANLNIAEVNDITSKNKTSVPEAKGAMDKFKMEVASELGVNLKEGYNGDLTSREAGSIGGEMVRKMIKRQEEQMSSGN